MRFGRHFAIGLSLAFVVVAAGSLACAQTLELKVQFDKSEFLLGEPIVAYVTVKNTGTGPQPVVDLFEPDFQFFKFLLSKDGGNEKLFRPWALIEGDYPERTLQPGESLAGAAKIFFGADGWTFATPGQYSVRVSYGKDLVSEPARVTVRAPSSDTEKQQADLILGENEVGYFLLFESGDHLQKGVQRLQDLVKRFPDSPLAAYADFALGMNLSRDFANFKEKRLRKADYSNAVSHLDRSKDKLARRATFYFTATAYDRLAESYTNLGRPQDAGRVRQQLNELISRDFPSLRAITPKLAESLRIKLR